MKIFPFQVLQKYFDSTKYSGNQLKLQNIWTVGREGEDQKFRAHSSLEHRKLLWHGTNVAVVAAILKTGLRIMPHSGGRVGRGIYFASENAKSAAYSKLRVRFVKLIYAAPFSPKETHAQIIYWTFRKF